MLSSGCLVLVDESGVASSKSDDFPLKGDVPGLSNPFVAGLDDFMVISRRSALIEGRGVESCR
jgi:hypothetical protein